MKIVIEQEVENCRECPFCVYENYANMSFYTCQKNKSIWEVPNEGISILCPFKKTNERED